MTARLTIDFDNTIAAFRNFPDIGPPVEDIGIIRKYFKEIQDMGFEIAIYTCRTSKEVFKHPIDRREQVRKIVEYMEKHEIPYDEILMNDKPVAQFYIDDSAIRYNGSWKNVTDEIKGRSSWITD